MERQPVHSARVTFLARFLLTGAAPSFDPLVGSADIFCKILTRRNAGDMPGVTVTLIEALLRTN